MRICRLQVQGDLELNIKQVNHEFALKKISVVSYWKAIQRLIKSFKGIRFEHTP